MNFFRLRVSKIIQETEDTKSFYFDIPTYLSDKFLYNAGQFLTLKIEIEGKSHRRAYSIPNSPHENRLGVTIKRVFNGLVSNYLNDRLQEGDYLDVLPPMGGFFNKAVENPNTNYVLIAAGSGITPIFAILKDILQFSNKNVILVYGNKLPETSIYLDELLRFEVEYSNFQLYLAYSGCTNYVGRRGRIDKPLLGKLLNPYAVLKDVKCFVCGPNQMIELVDEFWKTSPFKEKPLFYEKFSNELPPTELQHSTKKVPLTVTLDEQSYVTNLAEGEFILDRLLSENIEAPYSCKIGNCSSCIAKVLYGKVVMQECKTLDEEEIKEGYILTCQAYAVSEELTISFDN